MDVLIIQPQMFVLFWFCLSFFNQQPKRQYLKIFIITFCHSVYTDAIINFIPLQLHFVNSVAALTMLIFLVFRELRFRSKLTLLLFNFLLGILTELVTVGIALMKWGAPLNPELIRANIPFLASTVYPTLLVIIVIGWLVRQRNLFSLKRIYGTLAEGSRGPLVQIVVFIVLQTMLLVAYQFTQISEDRVNLPYSEWIIYAVILISLLAFAAVVRLLANAKDHAFRTTQEVYIEDINNMFTSIRGQRHDFLNHLQVIHTMAQMNRTNQLKAYVGDLVVETREVSDIVSHDSPALAAFAHSKMTVATGKGIPLTFELPSDWNVPESAIKVIDIIKILGHLIDHALEEASPPVREDGQVEVRIRAEDSSLLLIVRVAGILLSDNSDAIPHAELRLEIVKERVRHYSGSLDIHADLEANTEYVVKLPKFERLLA